MTLHSSSGLPRRCARWGLLWLLLAASGLFVKAAAAQGEPQRVTGANFKQANKYSSDFLRQFTYSLTVDPNWIGKTDSFWYEYRTSKGKQWYRVNPREAAKEPLFDRAKLSAALSEQVRKPLDPLQLPLTRVTLSDDGGKLKFVTDGYQFEYELRADKLVKLGKAPAGPGPGNMSPEQQERMRQILGEERFKEFLERGGKKKDESFDESLDDDFLSDDERLLIQEVLGSLPPAAAFVQEDEDSAQQKKFGKGGKKGGAGFGGGDYRNFSPDKKWFAFVKNHNLYLAEAGKEDEPIQLTKDGNEDYTFTAGIGFGGQQFRDEKDQEKRDDKDFDKEKDLLGDEKKEEKKDPKADKDRKLRAPVTWAKDSKSFYVQRRDGRGVKELFLVNSVAEPRPTLMKYKYPMPGEEHIRKSELYVFQLDKKALVRIEPRWKDESYSDLHWGKNPEELRFLRRDRLHRNIEFCTHNTRTADCKCVIIEGFENSSIVTQPIKYLEETDEMIWWSERTGWGHYYLCERSGKLKNPITRGEFRASTIVDTDIKNRLIYFRGNAREPGENVYWNHLYCVRLDGTGLTLMDPGEGDHQSKLSPSREFVVDNCSRADLAPVSVLRDARGKQIMELERADLSKLYEIGWKMPETFVVKAADGITDLFGNMFKPFDFDPKKKYPVIAHVYPGPQTESMSHSFKPYIPQQQLAQLGFIVIQVGNRGGTPLRSKAYQSHSYWNMRDYGLADKKVAIEQLAARHNWIDIERIGIYGHSGGGFMSAAALLVKPYNEFFKVAVSSAGNHDNNVYNNSWAERYHGMKEVPVTKEDAAKSAAPPTKKKGFGFKKQPPDTDEDPPQVGLGRLIKKDEVAKDKRDDLGKDKKDDKASKDRDDKKEEKVAMRWEIRVPTNPELAANLKGKLLLVHGDMDNNVHPANTIRLADALIKANKRFDMLIMPGKAHGFANYQPYFTQRMWEYFAEHLLDDRPTGADLYERRK